MTDKPLNELLHGKDFSDKVKMFDDGIEKIEKENIDFFKNRPSKSIRVPHDKLFNHYVFQSSGVTVSLAWHDNPCQLPDNIQKEILDLFKLVWE